MSWVGSCISQERYPPHQCRDTRTIFNRTPADGTIDDDEFIHTIRSKRCGKYALATLQSHRR